MSLSKSVLCAAAIALVFGATPAIAQQAPASGSPAGPPPGVVGGGRGDFLAVGLGLAVSPSYSGSNDYVFSPIPLVQGSVGGIEISPRGAGLTFDFVPDGPGAVDFDLGVAGRLRSDRANQIKDEVVRSLGELDRAIELGPTAGVSVGGVLNPFDSLGASVDVMWDINGAHEGMVIAPSVSYFTPLSTATVALLTLGTEWTDAAFHDYYFTVTPAQSAATAGELFIFSPDGGGFTSAGVNLLLAHDLSGDLRDGGWGLFGFAGYSRVLGDARRTPFTSVRGTPDQAIAALGVGYTF